MCSVLFVDIVGYSKKTNSEQMALKERFVSLWNQSISDVPPSDIMVVDSGDGAAMTSLVEPEDCIRVALKLKSLLELDAAQHSEPMMMCMGINFGPIRISTDVHGNPCVVGDAINIAQRIMSFSDSGQIMISRSYYDVITPLSHTYEEMFYYLGKRADKHIRYHDVYGLGSGKQPGALGVVLGEDQTNQSQPKDFGAGVQQSEVDAALQSGHVHADVTVEVGRTTHILRGTTKILWRIAKETFALVIILLIFGTIYELATLGPALRSADAVKAQLLEQVEQVKVMWSGIKAAGVALEQEVVKKPEEKSEVKPTQQSSKPKSNTAHPAADTSVGAATSPRAPLGADTPTP